MSADEPASEETETDAEPEPTTPDDGAHGDEGSSFATERTTAPQSPYTGRDVAVGALVAAVGIALTVVVPFLLA